MPKHTIAFFDVTEKDRIRIGEYFSDQPDVELILEADPVSSKNVDHAKNADAVSIFVSSTLDKALLDCLPKVKLVACRSTGFNNIDPDETRKRGIVITNVPSYGEHTVAEYTFLLMLAVCRRLTPSVEQVREGHVDLERLTGMDLYGKTLGVVGTGKIGRHVIQIAKGFEMNILGYDVFPNEEAAKQLGFQYAAFDELLAKSHIVSLHTPYLPDNRHLMNVQSISKMQRGSVLINTARGELVDNAALVHALTSRRLAGAGLDVIEGEAAEGNARLQSEILALKKMPNVVLTPHNAFNTKEATERILNTSLENISSYLRGEVVNQVSKN